MESPAKDLESQIEGFLEQVKQSAVRAMEDLPSDGWLTNDNIVHTILKRSRSDISSSDDGTLHSAGKSELAKMAGIQYWEYNQEVQPTVIWKLDGDDPAETGPIEYTVVNQAPELPKNEPGNNQVLYVANTNYSQLVSYVEEEVVEQETDCYLESGDVEIVDYDSDDNRQPETATISSKKKPKTGRKAPKTRPIKKKVGKIAKGKRKTESRTAANLNCLKYDELTRLEDNAEQVAEVFKQGCECGEGCFENFNAEKVFRHRLNIADLTKAEHDMYLMGVIHSSMQNPEETRRKKERIRLRTTYAYHGKRVCLSAFLYLEHVTLYQLKRIRKHLQNHGVSPRIHGNHGRKPFNTLPLDIYQHATHFVQMIIEQHHVKTDTGKSKGRNNTSYRLPADYTKKTLHDEYRRFCQQSMPSTKIMQYSTFTSFFKKQFPNVKFRKGEKPSDRRMADESFTESTNKLKRVRKKREEKVTQTVTEPTDDKQHFVNPYLILGSTVLEGDEPILLQSGRISTQYLPSDGS